MKKLILIISVLILAVTLFAQQPEMIMVEGGDYIIGNDYGVNKDEAPEHKVTLSGFMIGKYEVTCDDFDKFCKVAGIKEPDDANMGRGKKPVRNISWEEAVKYCNWLSKITRLDKCYKIEEDSTAVKVTCNFDANGYRLPTEAEWEYAAKGGNKSKGYSYSGSYEPNDVAWYVRNSSKVPHDVGTKKPNELGIYDMTGNVCEWCWDYYSSTYYQKSEGNNPKGPSNGMKRVYRGGEWQSKPDLLRMSARGYADQKLKKGKIGFRLVKKAQ